MRPIKKSIVCKHPCNLIPISDEYRRNVGGSSSQYLYIPDTNGNLTGGNYL